MISFTGLTVLVLATNEQSLLRKTLNLIIDVCGQETLEEIVLIVPSHRHPAAKVFAQYAGELRGVKLRMYTQESEDKILFFSEVPFLAHSSHFVIMGADMEMDPNALGDMIRIAKQKPQSIICAAKWLTESHISGYGRFHRFANVEVNRLVARIMQVSYKDIFSIYQMYPRSVFEKMQFQNKKTLLFEYSLKPIARGIEYIEIPTVYNKRTEEKPNTDFLLFCRLAVLFISTALKMRFGGTQSESSFA